MLMHFYTFFSFILTLSSILKMDFKSNLIYLPDEILLNISKDDLLSVKDIFNLHTTCHRFDNIYESQDLWKSKFSQRWPWIWKRMLTHQKTVQDWKNEVHMGIKVAKSLHEKLQTFSAKLHNYQNLTVPVIASLYSLMNIGSWSHLFLLNELQEILKENSKINLTKKYYACLVLQHLHKIECTEEWKKYFNLPPSKQTLERGAFYFAKWFQSKEFLNYEYNHMKNELDSLAYQTLSYLRTKYPQHPAVSNNLRNLIDPDEALMDSLWQCTECEQLFESINHVIFSINNYKGNEEDYYLMENSFINKVMEMKRGIPVTLSILYQAVCHRVGILLYPVNCPSHFMMKWKVPNTTKIEFIDAFHGGSRTDANGMSLGTHPTLPSGGSGPPPARRVLSRMANNTIHVAERNSQYKGQVKEICLAAEISVIFKPDDIDTLEYTYNLYLKLELHVDRIISGCTQVLESAQLCHDTGGFQCLLDEAKGMLTEQEEDPKPRAPKRRSAKEEDVCFATGMIMTHKLYGYTCVIFGWDTTCMMPMSWIMNMNIHSLERQQHQPFYNVLVADGSHRYAAQENLLNTDPVLVPHHEIGKYFNEFNGHYYVPNRELSAEYPDDDAILKNHYPRLAY